MKQQSIGIVLSALLLTTFGHELLQRHQVARSARIARSPKVHQSHAKSHFLKLAHRASPVNENECFNVCTPEPICGPSLSLLISVNVSANIVRIVNETAGVGIIIDIKANLIGIFRASSFIASIINLAERNGKTIFWNTCTDFETLFASDIHTPITLTGYWNKGGHSFSENDLCAADSEPLSEALKLMSDGGVTAIGKNALTYIIQIFVRFNVVFKVAVKVLESSSSKICITLESVVEFLEGFVAGISRISPGARIFVEKKITFSLADLLLLGSSVEVAVYVLVTMSTRGVGDESIMLTSIEAALDIVAAFSGSSTRGARGFFNVLGIIAGFPKVSMQTLLHILIEFLVNNSNRAFVKQYRVAVYMGIKTLQSNTGLSKGLKIVLSLLSDIKDNFVDINQVNFGDIMILLVMEHNMLNLIVSILMGLMYKIGLGLAIANLLVYLFVLLVQGSFKVVAFVIGVAEITYTGNLVHDFKTALSNNGDDFVKAVGSVKVLAQMTGQLDVVLSLTTLPTTVANIFSAPAVVKVTMQLFQQYGIKIKLSVGGGTRLRKGDRLLIRPGSSGTDYGGNGSGNSSQIQNFQSMSGTNTHRNNSGGTSNVQSSGAINVWSQNGKSGGAVRHDNNNNNSPRSHHKKAGKKHDGMQQKEKKARHHEKRHQA